MVSIRRQSLKLVVSAFLVASLLFVCPANVCASASSDTLDILFGGELDDKAAAIVQAGDGGYVIAGTTRSFGAGGADFWLIKVDSSGNMQWNMTYGGAEADTATDMVRTSDGGYVMAGETYSFGAGDSDFWLIKVDSSGNMQWNRTYGQVTEESANSVIQSSDGGYALAGYFVKNESNTDGWLVKTDSEGNMEWNRTYGGVRGDYASSVIQTSDGGYALAGRTYSFGDSAYNSRCWLVKTDAEGNMEWEKAYRDENEESKKFTGYSVVQTDDGGYTLAASAGFIIGIIDVWVAHVDSSGNIEWQVTWGPVYPAIPSRMIQTSDGGYAVSGWVSSMGGYPTMNSYLFLVTISSNGGIQRGDFYEGLGDNFDLFAVQTDDGGYAMAGTTQSRDEGSHSEVWFARVNASGEQIPEFGSWTPMVILLCSVIVVVAVYKQRLHDCNKRK
ncbi:MAG: hypothetical protein CW691_11755 [Candidatus Bathyarchaeum sp.]|nr:MAG: hypothetical protein CW691_11755 [Candidatus Bathyarchaeum sp.]